MTGLFADDPDPGEASNTAPIFYTGEKARRHDIEPPDWLTDVEKRIIFGVFVARLYAQIETGFRYTVEIRTRATADWLEVWAKYERTTEPFVAGPECRQLRRQMELTVEGERPKLPSRRMVDEMFKTVRDC